MNLATIQRRFDALAIDQLRDECARLAEENDRLSAELASANGDANWAHEAMLDAHEQLANAGHRIGMTREGRLGVIAEAH